MNRRRYRGLPDVDPWAPWPPPPPGPTEQAKARLIAELEIELRAKPSRWRHNRCHFDPCDDCREPVAA